MFLGKNWKLCLNFFLDKMGLEIMSDDHLGKKKTSPPRLKY